MLQHNPWVKENLKGNKRIMTTKWKQKFNIPTYMGIIQNSAESVNSQHEMLILETKKDPKLKN